MQRLAQLNSAGTLRAQGAGQRHRGFVCNGRVLPGLYAVLRRMRLGGSQERLRSPFASGPGSGLRLLRSTTRLGVSAHLAVAERLAGTRAARARGPFADTCAQAAALFAQRAGLRLAAAELVVQHAELPLATRFDALLVDAAGRHELLSWKTGCGPRHEADLRLHKTQLAMERRMLERAHGVAVHRATLLYLGVVQQLSDARMVPAYKGYALTRAEGDALCAAVEQRLAARRARPAARRARVK